MQNLHVASANRLLVAGNEVDGGGASKRDYGS
jgi:hypothetical protein